MAVNRTLLASGTVVSNQANFNVTISGDTGRKLIFTGSAEAVSGVQPAQINNINFNAGAQFFSVAREDFQPTIPSNGSVIWYLDILDSLAAGSYNIVATWNNAIEIAQAVTEVTGLVLGGPEAVGGNNSASQTAIQGSATAVSSETYGVSCVSGGNNQSVSANIAGTEYIEIQGASSGMVLGASDENTFIGIGSKTMGWTTSPAMNRLATSITIWEIIPDINDDGAAGMMAANM